MLPVCSTTGYPDIFLTLNTSNQKNVNNKNLSFYSFCLGTKHILKIDDNTILSYDRLMVQMDEKHGLKGHQPHSLIECPSPTRNMRPIRPRSSGGFLTIIGKFGVKTCEMNRRYYVVVTCYLLMIAIDFCCVFAISNFALFKGFGLTFALGGLT